MENQAKKTMYPMIIIFVVISAMIAISLYYLYNAIQAYTRGVVDEALYYTLLSGVGICVSIYMTYLIRKRTLKKTPVPKIFTSIECDKCGFKNLRTFVKGDFVFKSVDNCQKCNEPMLITGIYAEEIKKK
ncbi:MAG: hypothetical protein V1915_04670 [Candidatus Bathyarchaeota archaeon]